MRVSGKVTAFKEGGGKKKLGRGRGRPKSRKKEVVSSGKDCISDHRRMQEEWRGPVVAIPRAPGREAKPGGKGRERVCYTNSEKDHLLGCHE